MLPRLGIYATTPVFVRVNSVIVRTVFRVNLEKFGLWGTLGHDMYVNIGYILVFSEVYDM